MKAGLTISQAAAYAGVTIKTIRHYHRLGLVGEPERDTSGYRRYASTDLLRLVQVRTLAGAGVPLSEIADVLDADSETFARSVADVERRLDKQIEELVGRRGTLRRLAHGNRVLLPERACAVVDRLTTLGFDPDFVEVHREALVLARALAPEFFDSYVMQLEARHNDPQHVELLKRMWEAESLDPDDPRVDELADAFVENLLTHRELLVMPEGFGARSDAALRYNLLNHHREGQYPTSARLTELIDAKLRAAGLDVPDR